jgi:FkbM family methyltransferase
MANIMRRMLRRKAAPTRHFPPASDHDIDACYRFFLKRPPDREGRAHWRAIIQKDRMDVYRLMQEFLRSEEFWLVCHNRHKPWPIQCDGFKILVRLDDAAVGAYIAAAKTYEPHVTKALSPLLRPGTVFLDIGANIGYYTLLTASRVGPEGRVVALEPNPDNCELLLGSIKENGFTNIHVYPYAAAEKKQVLGVYPDMTNSTSLVVDEEHEQGHSGPPAHVVEAVALDELLVDLSRIDVVKMDIDGGEPRALLGMRRLIERHRPVLFVEFCPPLITAVSRVAPESLLDQISRLRYDLFIIEDDGQQTRCESGKDQILQRFSACTGTHLDLVAYPQ